MVAMVIDIPSTEELEALDGRQLDDVLTRLNVATRQVESAIVAAAAECERRSHHLADGHRTVSAWILATTNCSPGEATARARTARALRSLPEVRTEFAAGRVGVAQVREIARLAANPRCGELVGGSERVLLDAAQSLEYREFTTATERWLQLADADGAHRAHELAHEYRNARLHRVGEEFRFETSHGVPQGDAMRTVFERFCDAEYQHDRAIAVDQYGPDATQDQLPRSARQRRADAFLAMTLAAAAHGVGDGAAIDVTVNLVMDVDQFEQYTREQIDDTPVGIDPAGLRSRRCETIDGIPVDPRQAVALAFLGRIRRVVVNTAGIVVNAGQTRRLFDGALRQAIIAVDPVCAWLGCSLRAQIAQIDHLEPAARGGPTNASNGKVMCEHHNLFKQRSNFGTTRNTDGSITITRPDGTQLHPPDAA